MNRVGLNDAALAAGVLPGTIRQWVRRQRIKPPVGGRWYCLEEIEAYSYRRDLEHGGAALSGRRRRGETRRRVTV